MGARRLLGAAPLAAGPLPEIPDGRERAGGRPARRAGGHGDGRRRRRRRAPARRAARASSRAAGRHRAAVACSQPRAIAAIVICRRDRARRRSSDADPSQRRRASAPPTTLGQATHASTASRSSSSSTSTSQSAKSSRRSTSPPRPRAARPPGSPRCSRRAPPNGIAIVAHERAPEHDQAPERLRGVAVQLPDRRQASWASSTPASPRTASSRRVGGLPANASHYKQLIVTLRARRARTATASTPPRGRSSSRAAHRRAEVQALTRSVQPLRSRPAPRRAAWRSSRRRSRKPPVRE